MGKGGAKKDGGGGGEGNGGKGAPGGGNDEGFLSKALKRKVEWQRGRAPPNKRRRMRGGAAGGGVGDGATARKRGGKEGLAEVMGQALEEEAGEMAEL